MTTNYEKYYGTPEKAAEMQAWWNHGGFFIMRYDIDTMDNPNQIAFVECEPDDPAAMLDWLLQEAR